MERRSFLKKAAVGASAGAPAAPALAQSQPTTHMVMQAEYDSKNPTALARLLKSGVKLRPFSKEIMDACYKAATEVMDEDASKNAKFKKIHEPWKRFRQDQNQWFSVAEAPMQNYMVARK